MSARQHPEYTALGTLRIKRFSSKVRTGCKTCRKRRVKCDEGKPLCMKCSKAGVACEGYQATFVHKFEPSSSSTVTTIATIARLPRTTYGSHEVERPMISQPYETQDTLRSFQYYVELFCPVISRTFPDTEPLWARILPQAARTHAVVMHALTSAALSNEDASSATASDLYIKPRKQFHYSSALRMLTQDQPDIRVVLLSCIALFMFSCYERQEQHARLHVSSGYRIVKAYQARITDAPDSVGSEEKEIVEQICIPFFDIMFSTMAFIFPKHEPIGIDPVEVQGFTDAREAADELVHISRLVAEPSFDCERSLSQLRTWQLQFENMTVRVEEGKARVLMLFFKCIDRTVDLFTASADLVVRPTRLRFTIGLISELCGASVVDNRMRHALSRLLDKIEQICETDEDIASVQCIQIKILQCRSKPVVPFS